MPRAGELLTSDSFWKLPPAEQASTLAQADDPLGAKFAQMPPDQQAQVLQGLAAKRPVPAGRLGEPTLKELTPLQKGMEDFHNLTREAAKLFVAGGAMGPASAGATALAAKVGAPAVLQKAAPLLGRAAVNAAQGALDPPEGMSRGKSAVVSTLGGLTGEAGAKGLEKVGQQLIQPAIKRTAAKEFEAAQAPAKAAFGIAEGARAQTIAESNARQQAQYVAAKAQRAQSFQQAMRQWEQTKAAQASQFEAATAASKTAQTDALRAHAQQGASIVAADLKASVPTLKDFPATEAGLDDMLYGRGRQMVHEQYDKVMQEIARKGEGQMVQVPVRTLEALKIPVKPPTVVSGKGGAPADLSMQMMDAAELAAAVTGKWKTSPGGYRQVAELLDGLGIGNPAARAEYKAFMGTYQFIDKGKVLKNGEFHPDAVLKALHEDRTVRELGRRGLGSSTEGPFALAARGIPVAPAPPVRPTPPPKPLKPAPVTPPTEEKFVPGVAPGGTFEPRGRLDTLLGGPQATTATIAGKQVPTTLPDWVKVLASALGGAYPETTLGAAAATGEKIGGSSAVQAIRHVLP